LVCHTIFGFCICLSFIIHHSAFFTVFLILHFALFTLHLYTSPMAADTTLDRIRIIDLRLRCSVGVEPEERRNKREVVINIVLRCDLRRAGRTDRLADTVDYKAVKEKVVAALEITSFQLLESLAERVAEVCLEDGRIGEVEVKVEKPAALRFARGVAVEITRQR